MNLLSTPPKATTWVQFLVNAVILLYKMHPWTMNTFTVVIVHWKQMFIMKKTNKPHPWGALKNPQACAWVQVNITAHLRIYSQPPPSCQAGIKWNVSNLFLASSWDSSLIDPILIWNPFLAFTQTSKITTIVEHLQERNWTGALDIEVYSTAAIPNITGVWANWSCKLFQDPDEDGGT